LYIIVSCCLTIVVQTLVML